MRDPEYYLDALYEAGCDDALIGTGQPGTIALEFVREAVSAAAAVKSAIANVTAAIPGAELIEAKPDLVGLSDVAEILQCSRQNIRKYMVSYPEFPKPVYTGASTLWHLWELASFAKINIPRTVAELSRTTFRINLDIQQHRYQKTAAGIWPDKRLSPFCFFAADRTFRNRMRVSMECRDAIARQDDTHLEYLYRNMSYI